MSIIKSTCRIHSGPTGNMRITLDKDFSNHIELPVKEKLLVKYDNETKIITIMEL